MSRFAVLGGGVMGEALIVGLQRRIQPAPQIVVAETRPERAADLVSRLGVQVAEAAEAVRGAEVIILVVKPQDIRTLLAEIGGQVADGALVVSIAAGIPTSLIESALPTARVVRAMPNTPARIECGLTGISPGASCDPQHLQRASELLSAVGTVVQVPESQQDAVTSVSGSGPAYLFYLAEAMIDGAIAGGIDPAQARLMVAATLLGSARLLQASDEAPQTLRANVTSPGGTTAAAIGVFDDRGVLDAIVAGIAAARQRGAELAAG
ncbi:MAG: pyrroline-5-carboxylate reductase [Actinomycetales bacterium]